MNYLVIAFSLGMLAAIGIQLMLLVTLMTSNDLWPPGEKSWPYYYHWTLVAIFNVSVLVVSYLDWSTWLLPRPATLVSGLVLTGLGFLIFRRGANPMDSDETMGLTGDLYTKGPYAYSRNPQYIGMIIGLIGFLLLVNSIYISILVIAHIVWVLLLPFAEEPHLEEEYGTEYKQYQKNTPRFVDHRTFRRLFQDQ